MQLGCALQTIFGTPLADIIRLSIIDDSNRSDHYHLTQADSCFFIFEYTSGRNYSFSKTNNLISNLKKKPSQSHLPGYGYKQQAITISARCFAVALDPNWLRTATLVPIPASKVRDTPILTTVWSEFVAPYLHRTSGISFTKHNLRIPRMKQGQVNG